MSVSNATCAHSFTAKSTKRHGLWYCVSQFFILSAPKFQQPVLVAVVFGQPNLIQAVSQQFLLIMSTFDTVWQAMYFLSKCKAVLSQDFQQITIKQQMKADTVMTHHQQFSNFCIKCQLQICKTRIILSNWKTSVPEAGHKSVLNKCMKPASDIAIHQSLS